MRIRYRREIYTGSEWVEVDLKTFEYIRNFFWNDADFNKICRITAI